MKKKVVTSVRTNSIRVADSLEGNINPPAHPVLSGGIILVRNQFNEGIRVNDIVRCDGLPFKYRPRVIWGYEEVTAEEARKDKSKKIKPYSDLINGRVQLKYIRKFAIYSPVQLISGLWVLRKQR